VPVPALAPRHAIHQATSEDLERRGVGDIVTLTVGDYRARPWRGRLAYRAIPNPVVMFGLGPIVAMMVGPRIATRSQRARLRRSVLATDVVLVTVIGGLGWSIGWRRFVLVKAPAAMLAGSRRSPRPARPLLHEPEPIACGIVLEACGSPRLPRPPEP
jgi:acyl-lipid omega-6 desaturase (Delta-12 desaturase)